MLLLITGLTIFFGIHLLPSLVPIRKTIIDRVGELPYKGLFSLFSLTGFILIIMGMRNMEFVAIWQPPAWGRIITFTLMPIAFILVVAANMPSNIKRFTRHPMLWGITLWAASHLIANGDLASIILFTTFAIYSLFDMASSNIRGARKSTIKLSLQKDIIVIGVGLLAFIVFLYFHHLVSGVRLLS